MVGAQGRIRCLPQSGVPRRCRSSQTGLLYPFTVSEESPPTLWVSVELLSCVGALVSNFVPRSYKLKEGKKDDQLPPFRLGRLYGESRYGSSAPPPGTWIGMSIGSLGFGSHGGESGRLLARRICGMSNFGGIDLSR